MTEEIRRLQANVGKWQKTYDLAGDDYTREMAQGCILSLESQLIEAYRNLGMSYTAPSQWGSPK